MGQAEVSVWARTRTCACGDPLPRGRDRCRWCRAEVREAVARAEAAEALGRETGAGQVKEEQ